MAVPGSLLLTFSAGIVDNNGDPLSGGLVYTYVAGTSTPLATYSDSALSVANANPVVLDAYGRATIYLSPLGYKIVVKTAAGVLLWDEDNVRDGGSVWLATNGAAAGAKGQATGYTVVAGDGVVTINEATTNPAIVNLPPTTGWYTELTIKNVGIRALAVTPNGAELIEGSNSAYTVPVASGVTQPAITLKANAGNWYITGSHKVP